MEVKPELIWIIGGILAIILAIIFAKKVNVKLNWHELKMAIDKTNGKKAKSNILKVKGNKNITKQDVNNNDSNSIINNMLKVKGDENETDQDVNNSANHNIR